MPKRLVDAGGSLGALNGVRATGLEHKMGIHGSPTCSMHFEDSLGQLVGEPGGGMAAMFTMMNVARLSVGIEGLGISERAQQAAVAYAQERVQGRVGREPAVIARHPDVRRMLLANRTTISAMRLLTSTTAAALDLSLTGSTDEQRAHGREVADVLTPLAKAWSTERAAVVTRNATQVHGGAGYVTETGAEQHERDARITAIYEGTNGIQAIDLVTRKLGLRDGAAMQDLLEGRIKATAASPRSDAVHAVCERALLEASALAEGDPLQRLAAAPAFLDLVAVAVAGSLLCELADEHPEDAALQAQADLFVAAEMRPAATAQPSLLERFAPVVDVDAAAL